MFFAQTAFEGGLFTDNINYIKGNKVYVGRHKGTLKVFQRLTESKIQKLKKSS